MTGGLVPFLQTVAATAAFINGVFFWRFWQESRDQLFAMFAFAFWLLSASWAILAVFNPTGESLPYAYALRLLAFLLLIGGIVHKNRPPSRS
jgi:hypothetical protein